jgi:hypothetical protein
MLNLIKNLFHISSLPEPTEALDVFDSATLQAEKTIGTYIEPVRKSIFRRFPILFSLLVTSGVTATFLGIEKLILKYQIFETSPELILLLGISILAFTGTLYKKLG